MLDNLTIGQAKELAAALPIDFAAISRALDLSMRVVTAVPPVVAALEEAIDYLPLHSEARQRALKAVAEMMEAMS